LLKITESLTRKRFWHFFSQKSARNKRWEIDPRDSNPCTFALRSRRVPLPDVRGHSVIL